MKEEALDRSLWRTRFGRRTGHVVKTDNGMMINEAGFYEVLWGRSLSIRILKTRKHTEESSKIENLAFSLLITNRYVLEWTGEPVQTLPLASHKCLAECEGVKEELQKGTSWEEREQRGRNYSSGSLEVQEQKSRRNVSLKLKLLGSIPFCMSIK
jgi:hypothetical protein